MATTAIIDTGTRCIRGLTTDAAPPLAAHESAVVVADGFDLAGGPWKLVGTVKTRATVAEWQASGYDEAFNATRHQNRRGALAAAFAAVLADATVPASLETLLTALAAVEQDR